MLRSECALSFTSKQILRLELILHLNNSHVLDRDASAKFHSWINGSFHVAIYSCYFACFCWSGVCVCVCVSNAIGAKNNEVT